MTAFYNLIIILNMGLAMLCMFLPDMPRATNHLLVALILIQLGKK